MTDGQYLKEAFFHKKGFGCSIYGFQAFGDTVLFSSASLKQDEGTGNYAFQDAEYSYYDAKKEHVSENIITGSDEDTDTLFVKEDKIYYCKEKSLYAFSMKDGSSEEIVKNFFDSTLPMVSYDMENMYCRDDASGVISVYDTTEFKKKGEISSNREWSMLFGDANYLFALNHEKGQLMVYGKKQGSEWKCVDYNEWIE